MSAWADGNKRVLNSQNYETAEASDWTCPNGSAVLKTGDATYGKYAQCYPSGAGNRSCYKSVTFGYEAGTGYTTADMATEGYNIEFDFVLVGGNVVARSQSQFIVPTTGPNLSTNNPYSGTDYIFALTQPSLAAEGANAEIAEGKNGTALTTWYINDLTNATTTTINLDGSTWYHLKLVVTTTSVAYTITNNSTSADVATGSKAVSALPTITGFFDLLGRGSGKINFDNLEIYDYTASITVTEPTFTFKKVDGANRIYTLANPDGSGKLYYTTTPAESAPAVGDAAYTSTTATSLDVTYGTSGTYYAYVLHSNGTTSSAVVSQAVTAGALTLATPTFTITDFVQAADGFYYPKVSFSSNNSSLEGAPTATFDVTSPYTFTETGSITVTASAEGYTSNSSTFEVTNAYVNSKTIDFGALTADDFDTSVWTTATGAPRDYWTNRAAAIPADVTYYKLIDKSAETSSTALSDITISNASTHDPQVYIGYGLLTPYYQGVSGSNMNFTVNGATADDYAVYNGWNNYGSGTFNTILAGNATFGLYRYDTMLRTINLYSPVPASVSKSISAAGWATYCSPYALDFSGVSGLTAYIVTGYKDGSTTALNLVEVASAPANTGLIFKGNKGEEYTIPVAASSSTDVTRNKLIGVNSETTIDLDNDDDDIADSHIWVLMNGSDGVGFYYTTTTSFTLGANTAYLGDLETFKIPSGGSVKSLSLFGDDTATGIENVIDGNSDNSGAMYNLSGQRVNASYKGIVIKNGKKYLVK